MINIRNIHLVVAYVISVCILDVQARSCRGKASEGSQGFSILLLMSCIFMYASILPYSFEASSLICALRPFATSLSYAIMLAIFLARSLMLATSDSEGYVWFIVFCRVSGTDCVFTYVDT